MLSKQTEYETLSFADGRECEPGDAAAVTARWPKLTRAQWPLLLAQLQENRSRAPRGAEFWERLEVALAAVASRLGNPADPLREEALVTLPGYTGYSKQMIRFAVGALDLMTLDQFPAAFTLSPTNQASREWQPMNGLPGRLRFYESGTWQRALGRLVRRNDSQLFGPPSIPDLVVGYGAGNVPGTALLIALLAQSATMVGGPPPAVVVKNSRREPIFTPLILNAIEAEDPDLVAAIAVLIWDYQDTPIQETLLSQADLVVAAAGDDTIAQIDQALALAAPTRPVRFHAHGHKVSFSAIGREMLLRGPAESAGAGQSLLDIVASLATLDSAFWDQHGCLSSRVHFVETGGGPVTGNGSDEYYTPLDYAERLVAQFHLLGTFLPRGAWPRQQIHDRFDRYKLLETTGKVQVLSGYDDEFLVVVDRRQLDAATFQTLVNDCQGRIVVVRPVADLMEVPDLYLGWLPRRNLQSLSVAVGKAGQGPTARFRNFAEACGARGVTAIRTVGRGAFPQMAYSWDGLIPLDLVCRRPAGHFTTIEFDEPHKQLMETYQLLLQRGAALELQGSAGEPARDTTRTAE